ncbi:preprotein translocase subunit SecY [Actinomycetes bacterium KLBMP 9759]
MHSSALSTIRAVLTVPDIRKKILFTLGVVVVARLGSAVPAPGVSFPNIQQCTREIDEGNGLSALFDLFSGGALLQLSIFAVGVLPYISATIIVQLLTVVIPRFARLKKEGRTGQNTLNQYGRYLTIALATLQAASLTTLAAGGALFAGCSVPVVPRTDPMTLAVMVVVMVAGAAVMMWLGERVTEKGVGNGISLLIFVSVAHRVPADLRAVADGFGVLTLVGVLAIGVVLVAGVVMVEQAQRRVPVQYAKRMVGRRLYGGTATYLPLKVNQAGVMPVIFAGSVLSLPAVVAPLSGGAPVVPSSGWLHTALYAAMIAGFAYFSIGILFDPGERAAELQQFGGFVPGIRPGRPTREYLGFVLNRLTPPGAAYLVAVAVPPQLLFGQSQSLPLAGVSVLIMVGVALETVKHLESQLGQHNYQGFLR